MDNFEIASPSVGPFTNWQEEMAKFELQIFKNILSSYHWHQKQLCAKVLMLFIHGVWILHENIHWCILKSWNNWLHFTLKLLFVCGVFFVLFLVVISYFYSEMILIFFVLMQAALREVHLRLWSCLNIQFKIVNRTCMFRPTYDEWTITSNSTMLSELQHCLFEGKREWWCLC